MLVAEPDKALTGGIRTVLDPIEAITEGPQIENETELTSANHTYNHTLGVSLGSHTQRSGGCHWKDYWRKPGSTDPNGYGCRHHCYERDWEQWCQIERGTICRRS